jgi:hypothetical protein
VEGQLGLCAMAVELIQPGLGVIKASVELGLVQAGRDIDVAPV